MNWLSYTGDLSSNSCRWLPKEIERYTPRCTRHEHMKLTAKEKVKDERIEYKQTLQLTAAVEMEMNCCRELSLFPKK